MSLEQLFTDRVVAVVRAPEIPDARALCAALAAGGIRTVELTFTTPDVLRHLLVLSYDALSDGVSADDLLDRVLAEVTEPEADHVKRSQRRVTAA